MYGAQPIAIRRSIKINNHQIHGQDERGGVVVENGLKIYMSDRDLAQHSVATWSLVEQLCSACRIPLKHKDIVTNIISQLSSDHVEAMLESHDIVFEKRIRPTFATKLIDDSAGVILPSASTVNEPCAQQKPVQPVAIMP